MYAAVMSSMEPPDHAYGQNETPPVDIQFLGFRDRFLVARLYEVLYSIERQPHKHAQQETHKKTRHSPEVFQSIQLVNST